LYSSKAAVGPCTCFAHILRIFKPKFADETYAPISSLSAKLVQSSAANLQIALIDENYRLSSPSLSFCKANDCVVLTTLVKPQKISNIRLIWQVTGYFMGKRISFSSETSPL
jgi:hypothetical protein